MECNKEDAIKAQEVAEQKILKQDYVSAKKFVLKAQRLFPTLSGLNQTLAVVETLCAASEASNELPLKWHLILQVDRNANDDTIRKQYRKLLLLLHPDKNKCSGAASAFKLLKDAYEAFEMEKKVDKPSANTSSSQTASKDAWFWSECPTCKKQSLQAESLENQYVQCLSCLRPYVASRIFQTEGPCQSRDESVDSLPREKEPADSHNSDIGAEKKMPGMDDIKGKEKVPSSSSSEERNPRRSRLKQTKVHSPMKRKHAQDTSTGPSKRKRRPTFSSSTSDTDLSSENSFKESPMGFTRSCADGNLFRSDAEINIGASSHHHQHQVNGTKKNDLGNTGKCGSSQDIPSASKLDATKIQEAKAQLFGKLKSTIMNEFNGGEFQVMEVRQADADEPANVGGGNNDKFLQVKLCINFIQTATDSHVQAAVSENCMVGGSEILEEDQQKVNCVVPDNDVYDFDKGRREDVFKAGQIWSIYDDDDGLPRFYAHIAEVISVRPFHVRMNWLFPAKTVSDEVQAWIRAGFAYTCGQFRLGKILTRKSVKIFSHVMAHEAGPIPRSVFIYPQKGDVWALYKLWKPRKGTTRRCEPVEVISHYAEELGVEVASLFKVTGYQSIYCRTGTAGLRFIPTSELLRFSHQIPAHFLVGNEVIGLPAEFCVDLDMAALSEDQA